MTIKQKTVLGMAGAALLLTTPMPLIAADAQHPVSAKSSDGVVTSTADYWGRRRWRHRDRIDGGDVLTGIGILAGIAIIADAASKADDGSRRRREEPSVYRDNAPSRYEEEPRASYGNDLGSAVTACTDAAERSAGGSARVQEIGSVTRNGDGWRVEGSLDRGANRGFSCSTSGGRVEEVRMDDGRI
jgi:hypothetical protein